LASNGQSSIQTNNSRINDLSRTISQNLKAQKLQLQKLQEQASSLASNGQSSIQTNNSRINDLSRTISQKLQAQQLQLQKLYRNKQQIIIQAVWLLMASLPSRQTTVE